MADEPMIPRAIRIDEETWNDALEAARRQGEPLSEAVRRFLRRYARSVRKERRADVTHLRDHRDQC